MDKQLARESLNNELPCNAPTGGRTIAQNLNDTGTSAHVDSNDPGYSCGYCDRSFASAIGVGQHRRQAHPVEYKSRIGVQLVKSRLWSDDERTALAIREVAAVKAGVKSVKDIVEVLASKFLGRTKEAIKCQRKSPAYKSILSRLKAQQGVDGVPEHAPTQDVTDDPLPNTLETEPEWAPEDCFNKALHTEIREAYNKLLSQNNFRAKSLANAVKASLHARGKSDQMMKWLNTVLVRKTTVKVSGNRKTKRRPSSRRPLTRTAGRKKEYAHLQKLYRRDEKRAAAYVLKGSKETMNGPSASDMFEFWGKTYSVEDRHLDPMGSAQERPVRSSEPADKIWAPIAEEDIMGSELNRKTAAGPDGVTVAQWRAIPRALRATFYNLLLYRGDIDSDLNQARTIFIPKTKNPSQPGDYRPISITSVVLRQLHKILAKRLQSFHRFDCRQRAFCRADGTAENLLVVKTVLDDARRKKSELHMASIDLSKAFDSVAHGSVLEAIENLGCPGPFVQYMTKIYGNASTVLQYDGSVMRTEVRKGVLQGDPLSPALFNFVMDRALAALSNDLGYSLGNNKLNCVAYADDIILLNGSKAGLQLNLSELVNALRKLGLEVNPQKSWALSQVPLGKEKKIVVLIDSQFSINDVSLRQIGVLDPWKYLGVHFKGTSVCGIRPELLSDMAKVSNAPLKPQQKIRMLKTFVFSKYYHQLVLGEMSITALHVLDTAIRKIVRTWMHFPHGVPNAYIHAPVRIGGMGVTCFAIDVPIMRLKRLENVIERTDTPKLSATLANTHYYTETINGCRNELVKTIGGVEKTDRIKYWEDQLEGKFDTMGLTETRYSRASASWVWDKALSLTGRDYIRYHHIRAGCLPSRVRRARGFDAEINCRGGCPYRETNYHVIQQCQRTRGGRILRHNRIVDMIYENFRSGGGMNIYKEPQFRTVIGLRKPDLVLTDGHTAMVVDVHIVRGDNTAKDRSEKISKYRDISCFSSGVKRRYQCKNVVFETIAISYRGIFGKASAELLKRLKFDDRTLFTMSTSVLYGSWLNWSSFNKAYWRRDP